MKKLFLFGDSITAGYYDQDITDLLTARVQANFPDFQVVNAGIPGDTTEDGLRRIEEHVLRYQPDYVTVFFGANDVAIHNHVSKAAYQANLQQIIELIGAEKVILLSTPYAHQAVQGTDRPLERIKDYVAAAEALSQAKSMPFVNLLAAMAETGAAKDLLQADGLHFSPKGYDFLAQLISDALEQKLNQKEA